MKRYNYSCYSGGMAEDPDGKFVLHEDMLKEKVDVLADRIEIKKRHMELVEQYQKILDDIKAELKR